MAGTSRKTTTAKRAVKKASTRKASAKSIEASEKPVGQTTAKRTSKKSVSAGKGAAAKSTTAKKATTRKRTAKAAPEASAKVAVNKKATSKTSKATAGSKATTEKTTTRKTTTRKTAARKAKTGTAKASEKKAPALELVQLDAQDGQTKVTKRKAATRKRSAKAVTKVAEAGASSAKPKGLSSKAMSREARDANKAESGEVAAPVEAKKGGVAAPRRKALLRYSNALPKWPASAEMLSLRFKLRPLEDAEIYPQYNVGLHAWFLKQVKQADADLSRRLHDHPEEKAFTLSSLDGPVVHVGDKIRLEASQTYELTLTVFSKPVVKWLGQWLKQMPEVLDLKFAPMRIELVELGLAAMSYAGMGKAKAPQNPKLALSFVSPTSFKRKGNHLPLPMPVNLFGSYLRRWNYFAKQQMTEEGAFLDWVDENVLISRHVIHSEYQVVRKQDFAGDDELGGVTGFVGAVVLQLAAGAEKRSDYVDWWWRLGLFAPYCGTGHKTAFGLGQTMLGWELPESEEVFVSKASLIAQRRAELIGIFMEQRKQKGERARKGAETWATILARREQGESLMDIAKDLGLSHETTNKYAKLARRALRELGEG